MKALVALVAALSVAWGSATAFDGMPPPKYQGDLLAPTWFVQFDKIPGLCGYPTPKQGRFEGCSLPGKMVLPNPCLAEFSGQSFARLACHELAHQQGWPASHPDAHGRPQGPPMKDYAP